MWMDYYWGVTPDMGQTNFIVDSFLVVVTGGVGEQQGSCSLVWVLVSFLK